LQATKAQRLRPENYTRWMLVPLRIDPQTKMPKFAADGRHTKLTHIHDGDARLRSQYPKPIPI
jgi:hypothetical protein